MRRVETIIVVLALAFYVWFLSHFGTREVLNYVQFSADALVSRLRRDVETALRESRLSYEESGRLLKFYEEGLHGYTYLEDVHEQ